VSERCRLFLREGFFALSTEGLFLQKMMFFTFLSLAPKKGTKERRQGGVGVACFVKVPLTKRRKPLPPLWIPPTPHGGCRSLGEQKGSPYALPSLFFDSLYLSVHPRRGMVSESCRLFLREGVFCFVNRGFISAKDDVFYVPFFSEKERNQRKLPKGGSGAAPRSKAELLTRSKAPFPPLDSP